MLKTKTLSKQEDLEKYAKSTDKIAGFGIKKVTQDGCYACLRSITLVCPDGQEIEFAGGDSSNRILLIVPAPKEYKDCFVVKGKIDNVEIKDVTFEERGEAQDFINSKCGTVELTIEQTQTEV